jgi:hypothetical protein
MTLRAVTAGWVRAALFAALAILDFVLFHRVMARSRLAVAGFSWTFLGIPALSVLDDLRRRNRRPTYQPAPDDARFESRRSLAVLAWPVALLLWFFVPVVGVGSAVNFAMGEVSHNVAGAMGGMAAVAAGLLGGLAAWIGLRTLTAWRLGTAGDRWPLWTEVPQPSLSWRALRAEWPRNPVYYYRK